MNLEQKLAELKRRASARQETGPVRVPQRTVKELEFKADNFAQLIRRNRPGLEKRETLGHSLVLPISGIVVTFVREN
jgi:hypothetical protein